MPSTPRRNRTRALLFAVLAILVPPACATAPLVEPRPIAAGPTPAGTRDAILRVLARNGWLVEVDQPAQIVARRSSGAWTMVVEVLYTQQVAIHYVSSENLHYAAGGGHPRIHPGYNRRTEKLMDEIGRELNLERLGAECPAGGSPVPPAGAAVH